MDNEITIKYKHSRNHFVPVIHGALVTSDFGPDRIMLHLYTEHAGLPAESVATVEDGKIRTPATADISDSIIREVQVSLVFSADTAHTLGRILNAAATAGTENVEQNEGAEDV